MNNKRYKDIDLRFEPHPTTKDVVKLFDDNAIKQSIKNLLTLNFYEKWDSKVGSNVYRLLFEPMTTITAINIQKNVEQTLKNFEPRVELISTKVTPNYQQQSYEINVVFNIINIEKPVELDFVLERIR